jgi:hypothetical protein
MTASIHSNSRWDTLIPHKWDEPIPSLIDAQPNGPKDSPIHGIHVLQLSSIYVATPSVHHTATQNLEDIHVAYEFFDVFSKDLLSMPLN